MRVIIESPWRGVGETYDPIYIQYARLAMRDSLLRGEEPFASHMLYALTGVLDDYKPLERALGILAGLEWGKCAELSAIYIDYGISEGMRQGIDDAEENNRPWEMRYIGKVK